MTVRLALIICCSLITGCKRSAPPTAVISDSAGVTIVNNNAPVWKSGAEWRLDESRAVRIGAAESSDAAQLITDIDAVRRLSDGRIVVLEDQTRELRWFDKNGKHLFTRGGKGGGPGEFEATRDFLVLPGDSILVFASPRMRFVLFTSEGEYVRETPLNYGKFATLGKWMSCMPLLLPDRSLIGCQLEGERMDESTPGYHRELGRFVLTPPAVDRVIPLGPASGLEQWGVNVGGSMQFAHHPFHSASRVAAGGTPLRVATARNPEYSIELWSPEGRLERIVRRANGRLAPTDLQKKLALDEMRRSVGDAQAFNRFMAEMQVPDSMPAIMDLRISPSGHLWVSRAETDRSKPWLWDVFDRNGMFLGAVKVPAGFIMYDAGDDYLIGLYHDEDDVPYVMYYPIVKS